MFLEQEDGETKENKYIESINKQKEGKFTNHPTDVKKRSIDLSKVNDLSWLTEPKSS